MQKTNETELEYWERRGQEAIALADASDGDLAQAHRALTESYCKLIVITNRRSTAEEGASAA